MNKIKIEIAWMSAQSTVKRYSKTVEKGITIQELITELKREENTQQEYGISVYGKKRPEGYILCENDRIEVCLPLLDDPLLRRRARVKKVKRKS